MSETPTVPELPTDDTVLSPEGWQAMLWLRLGAIDRKLTVVVVLLGGILAALFVLLAQPH
jgi:hypothetical protein